MADNEDDVESRLLALAPELRNRVYRHALVRPEKIIIQPDGPLPTEPGLLRVCRQIRTEAKAIYLQENIFKFVVPGFDITNYIRFSSLSHAHYTANIRFRLSGMLQAAAKWRNLLVWLKAFHDATVDFSPAIGPKIPPDWRIAAHLFDLARHAKKKQRLSWKEIEKLLEHSRRAIAVTKPAWAI